MDATDIISVLKDYKNGVVGIAEASLTLILIGLSPEEVEGLLKVKVIEKLIGENNGQFSPSTT